MKGIIRKIFYYLKHPKYILLRLDYLNIIRLKDKTYIKWHYEEILKKKLNLSNPNTFNEKLQWLKLHDRKDIYTTMVDKYESKKYVADLIGQKHIIKTLGVYNRFDDIDFDKLPKQFVIKCTHDSGGIVIVRDKNKFNKEEAKKKIEKSLNINYYYLGREWPYKNVKPRIIVEEFLIDSKLNELRDYKFFCFNGEPKFFKVDFDRYIDHKANYFDLSGKILKLGEIVCPPDYNKKIELPKKLEEMIKLAKILSKDTIFLRVDFYEVNNTVLYGELTFYPASGFGAFIDDNSDMKLGELIKLPNK